MKRALLAAACAASLFTGLGTVWGQEVYVRLTVMMDPEGQRLGAGDAGQAAVKWDALRAHPKLSFDRCRIALAALLYGRILFAHEESRTELFGRVQRIADALAGNQAPLPFDPWTVSEARIPLRLWPWRIVKARLLGGSYDYVATLFGNPQTEFLGIHLVAADGFEAILPPSSTLIALYTLAHELSGRERRRIGLVLRSVNNYYRGPEGADVMGSEAAALRAAIPVLLE